MNFETKYERTPYNGEKLDQKSITETAGYIPPKIQIEQMILAGQRLNESRKAQFDYGPDEPDDGYTDPTRDPGYDMADASMVMAREKEIVTEGLKRLKAAYPVKKTAEAPEKTE